MAFCLFNVDLLCGHFCAGRDNFFLKVIAVGLLRCHMAIKNKKKKKKDDATTKQEIEEKVTYTHTEGKK